MKKILLTATLMATAITMEANAGVWPWGSKPQQTQQAAAPVAQQVQGDPVNQKKSVLGTMQAGFGAMTQKMQAGFGAMGKTMQAGVAGVTQRFAKKPWIDQQSASVVNAVSNYNKAIAAAENSRTQSLAKANTGISITYVQSFQNAITKLVSDQKIHIEDKAASLHQLEDNVNANPMRGAPEGFKDDLIGIIASARQSIEAAMEQKLSKLNEHRRRPAAAQMQQPMQPTAAQMQQPMVASVARVPATQARQVQAPSANIAEPVDASAMQGNQGQMPLNQQPDGSMMMDETQMQMQQSDSNGMQGEGEEAGY